MNRKISSIGRENEQIFMRVIFVNEDEMEFLKIPTRWFDRTHHDMSVIIAEDPAPSGAVHRAYHCSPR